MSTAFREPILLVGIGLLLIAGGAPAQLCFNNSIYLDLSDEQESFPICHDGILTCQEPELQIASIALDPPDCDQTFQSCAVKAIVDTKFPGNHQNDPSLVGFGYSFGTLLLQTLGGGFVDACGVAGAAIVRDVGQFIHSVGVPCELAKENPEAFKLRLTATMCPCAPGVPFCSWQAACEKQAEVILDFVLPTLECPPKFECCDECGECLGVGSGGAARNGAAAGMCLLDSGPGARLRYVAGGAGSENLPGSSAWTPVLGRGWSHDYAERLVRDPDDSRVWLITRFGSFREFRDGDGDGGYEYVSPSDEQRRLRRTAGGWQLEELDGTVHSFDGAGRWQSTLDTNGTGKTASYGAGGLTRVDMADGRAERFTYHPGGKLAEIIEVGVDGTSTRTWSYLWAGDDLVEILRPDATRLRFRYEDPRHPGYVTRSILVGTDGSERLETAWRYDHAGRAMRIWKGDASSGPDGPVPGPDAIEVWSMSFTQKDSLGLVTESRVTDPMGQVSTYNFGRDSVSAKPRVTRITGDCPSCGLGPDTQLFYEDPANPLEVTRTTDARGTVTRFEYDGIGQLISQTEAAGTALERTTTFGYHPIHPGLLASIEQPSTSGSGSRRTSWTYDGAGNATVRSEAGVESGSAFLYETVTTYNAVGRPETVNPPGYGTQDQTVFSYDPIRGNMIASSRTDPLVGTTSFDYDPFNWRTSVTDANGVVTETSYDPLNRVTSVTRKGATAAEDLVTTRVYNEFGDLFRIFLPEGNVIEYGYDDAGRLTSIERKPDTASRGERTLYTLDDSGNRIREDHQRWDGSAWVTESFTGFQYSSRCRLDKILHADGTVTEHAYDCNGNLERVWDANHPSANQTNPTTQSYGYDALDRLVSVTQPWKGAGGGNVVTTYGYDVQDHLTRVTDANGMVRRSVYSDRDLLTRDESEVTGATDFSYNEHGELTGIQDARGVSVSRSVDAFDRVTLVDYTEDTLDTTYAYDDPAVPFSSGRLTAMGRAGGTIDYRYDRFGRLTRDGALTFGYDRNGNRVRVGYPGGVTASYTYDFVDRQTTLSLEGAGGASGALVTAASYLPAGPLASLALGNGLTEIRDFEARYTPERIQVPGRLDWQYASDALGNVTAITDRIDPAGSRTYGYQDVQYFLTQGDGPWGSRAWTYDKIGNRLSENRDGAIDTYSYFPNAAGGRSPQLREVAPPASSAIRYFYSPAGDQSLRTQAEKKLRFSYDLERNLSQIQIDAAAGGHGFSSFSYDGRGFLREATSAPFAGSFGPQVRTTATYSSQGLLHHRSMLSLPGPTTVRSEPTRQSDAFVFYFAQRPVAIFELFSVTATDGTTSGAEELRYLTTDHLGTPVLATDSSGAILWQGGFQPFGDDFSDAMSAGNFLRFPGQWADEAGATTGFDAGWYYNLHRWYEPTTGRYGQPEPLGHPSEIGLYRYSANNPISYRDPLGLVTEPPDNVIPFPGNPNPYPTKPPWECDDVRPFDPNRVPRKPVMDPKRILRVTGRAIATVALAAVNVKVWVCAISRIYCMTQSGLGVCECMEIMDGGDFCAGIPGSPSLNCTPPPEEPEEPCCGNETQ